MCAYNKLNGVYCSENAYLLLKILRDEWGFEGTVISDWGAVNNRVKSLIAGMDLEMPGNGDYYAPSIENALEIGTLDHEILDQTVLRILNLVLFHKKAGKEKQKRVFHSPLSQEIAEKSAVLLKNQGILPLSLDSKVGIVGAMAAEPRFQGNGSSRVHPANVTSAIDALKKLGINYSFFPGYQTDQYDDKISSEAINGVKDCDFVIIFAGLSDIYESEGYDRENLTMPESHNRLIEKICETHSRVVIVLSAGAPVEMPWIDLPASVLFMNLAGQESGTAAIKLLFGLANPCGKLAETFPHKYKDSPINHIYGKEGFQNQYRESLLVGYRYYESANIDVLFPFGFGLSYTTFEYSQLKIIEQSNYQVKVRATIKNTGTREGAEIVELFIGGPREFQVRPKKELRGFEKIFLSPEEEKDVQFFLDKRSFAFYNPENSEWQVQEGWYDIEICASCHDVRL